MLSRAFSLLRISAVFLTCCLAGCAVKPHSSKFAIDSHIQSVSLSNWTHATLIIGSHVKPHGLDVYTKHGRSTTLYLPATIQSIKIRSIDQLVIHNVRRARYSLEVSNVSHLFMKGGAVVNKLAVRNVGMANMQGPKLYILHIFSEDVPVFKIENLAGGLSQVESFGSGRLMIYGRSIRAGHYLYVRQGGSGSIVIDQITNYPMVQTVNSSGAIHLNGAYTFNHFDGSSYKIQLSNSHHHGNFNGHMTLMRHYIALNGLNAPRLLLVANKHAHIDLGGYVGNAYIRVSDQAVISGASLTTHNANVVAHDDSLIHIHAGSRLFAQSYDKAHIEYNGSPKYRFVKPADQSAILPVSSPRKNAITDGNFEQGYDL